MEKKKKKKRRPRASNGQRYPLPCRTHFGNLKCAQQGKGTADHYWPWTVFLGSGPVGDDDLWYHHIPGTLRSVCLSLSLSVSVPPWGLPAGSETLPAGFGALPAGSRALPAGSEALPAVFNALPAASRLTQFDLSSSQHCSFLRGSPSLLGCLPSWL